MRILYYTWYENSQRDMSESLVRLGYEVVCCHIPFSDYEEDEKFTEALEKVFFEHNCDWFFPVDCQECGAFEKNIYFLGL